MKLEDLELTPTEGMLCVEFLEDDADGDFGKSPLPPGEERRFEGVLARVIAVGAKVKAKKGEYVLCGQYACEGLKFGDYTLISNWDVKATLSE